MSNTLFKNIPSKEVWLVADGDQQLVGTGNLIPTTGSSVNIANGQLGVVCTARGATRGYMDFLQPGDTIADAPSIAIVQGTPASADFSGVHPSGLPIGDQAYVMGPEINGYDPIELTSRLPTSESRSATVVTGITADSEAVYTTSFRWRGRRQDRHWSTSGYEPLVLSYESIDYTTAGLTSDLDHLIKNIVYNVNLQSNAFRYTTYRRNNKKVIALAVSSGAVAGGTTTAFSAITIGSTLNTHIVNGVQQSIVVDRSFYETLNNIVTNTALANTATVVNVDLSTAGNVAQADYIIFMATPDTTAYNRDQLRDTIPTMTVGLVDNWNTVSGLTVTEASTSSEVSHTANQLYKLYTDNHGKTIYSAQDVPYLDTFIQAPNYFTSANYSVYAIRQTSRKNLEYSHDWSQESFTRIAVPASYTAGTYSWATDAATRAGTNSLNTILGPWLQSANLHRYVGAGTPPAYFD